jgi:hypothetical protein
MPDRQAGGRPVNRVTMRLQITRAMSESPEIGFAACGLSGAGGKGG